jgi:Tfp pilus assembly protein PilO
VSAAKIQPFWRRRLLWPALGLLGLNLVVAAAYTLPRGLKRRGIAMRAETLRAEVESARRAVADLQRRADLIRDNQASETRLYSEVLGPRRVALVPTVSEIEKLAAEPGLKAGGRSFNPNEVKEAPLLRLGVSVSLTGGYGRLVEFLGGLERSKHFVTVDRVQLRERSGDEGEGAEGALSVQLSAWFRAEGETLDAR